MKYIAILLINLVLHTLSGCTVPSSDSAQVNISYLEREQLAPARWVFKPQTELVLTAYQWSFSDENYFKSGLNQQEEVTHVFQQPGVYRVRLEYQAESGSQGTIESEVFVDSGAISGKIFAAADNLVDFDTREPDEPSQSNNSFDTAQVIAATSRLSGVVDDNDTVDFYQLQLQELQQINIQVADENNQGEYEGIRLELFLADNLTVPVLDIETDVLTGRFSAAALVPNNGNYFIKISAINPRVIFSPEGSRTSSHGIYSLSLEQPANNQDAEFALGEVNILLKPERQYKAQGMSSKMDLGRIKTLSLNDARAIISAANIYYPQKLMHSIEEQQKWETLQVVEILSQHDDILYAEPNWKRYPAAVPTITDPFYPSQWHYDSINVQQAWQALDSLGSDSVIVAVIDTGVLTAHPDLTDNLVAGYDYVDGDANANDPGDKSISGQRSSFHGTHVAGTVAAAANTLGGTGVAPNVKIMPVRVLGQGGGFANDIIAGVCFAAQLTANDGIGCGNNNSSINSANIINLSLGGPGFSSIEQAVYNAVIAKGVIVIAAAGNESTSAPSYPAAYDKVISVAAVGRTLEQASYSNFGSKIDVAAPGGDFSVDSGILSSWGDDLSGNAVLTYGSLQGTSMAAPHVAGVAALMKSAKADLTHVEFLSYLNAGDLTQDLGSEGRDDIFGHGLIDAQKAVLQVQQNLGPQILSSNNSLFFNVSQAQLSFILTAGGVSNESDIGTLTAQIFDADKDNGSSWLVLDKSTGLGTYTASVNREDLIEGSYQGRIEISSSNQAIDDLIVSVHLQIGNPELSANAGVQFVLLIDADAEPNQEGVFPTAGGSSALIANDGQYQYQVFGLKKGNYTVSTGSDLDFDNIICDAGESCGQYPTIDQPKVITISEEQTHVEVNMSVNYLTAGSSSLSQNAQGKSARLSAYKIPVTTPVLKTLGEP